MERHRPVYQHGDCVITYGRIFINTPPSRSGPVGAIIIFETSVPLLGSTESLATHLVEEWTREVGVVLELSDYYSSSGSNLFTLFVALGREIERPHHPCKKVAGDRHKQVHFVSAGLLDPPGIPATADAPVEEAVTRAMGSSADRDAGTELGDLAGADEMPTTTTGVGVEGEAVTSNASASDLVASQVVTTQPAGRACCRGAEKCAVHLDYDSREFRDKISMSNFSRNEVYERARLQLAFFRHERDANVDLKSYVSNKIFLVNSGVPADDDGELERLFFKFGEERGLDRGAIEEDLVNTGNAIRERRLNQQNVARRNFYEYYGAGRCNTQNRRPYGLPQGRCDPEQCTML